MALVQDIKPEPQRLDRLVVKSGGRVFFLRTDDIVWIEAAGNYVRLHLGEDSHLFRETMNGMEARLDPRRFVRIHRSRIVNTDRIKELQPWFNGEYVVMLQNGTRLTLSRGYREKLQERLGKTVLARWCRLSRDTSAFRSRTVPPSPGASSHAGPPVTRVAGGVVFARVSPAPGRDACGEESRCRHAIPGSNRRSPTPSATGADRRPEQAFGDYFHGRHASCALGAAYEGMYRLPGRHGRPPAHQRSGGVLRLPGGHGARLPGRGLPQGAHAVGAHRPPERRPSLEPRGDCRLGRGDDRPPAAPPSGAATP